MSAVAGEWPSGGMRAVVMAGPDRVEEDERPVAAPAPGQVLARVAYVGICGTDAELLSGASAFIRQGLKSYPFVFGHEWSGTVLATGEGVVGVEPGDRVVGCPFITCGTCGPCRRGRRNMCERRSEMGVRGDHPGAASDYVRVPAASVTVLPEGLGLRDAPLVEPTVTAVRAVERTRVGVDDRVAVIGTGTLGLMALQAARAVGAEVHAIGVQDEGLALAAELGADRVLRPEEAERDGYGVVVEGSGSTVATEGLLDLVAPGGRIALVGIPSAASRIDTAMAVIKDVEVHGVLHGIEMYERTVGLFASGRVRPAPLVDRVVPASAARQAFDLLGDRRPRPKLLLEFAGGERVLSDA